MGERDFFMEKGLTGFTKWIPDSYFSSWQIDIVKGVAVHQSGGMLFFEGHPGKSTFQITPKKIPHDLTVADQARMIRLGVECISAALSLRFPIVA